MENSIPLKVKFELPLNGLENFISTVYDLTFDVNQDSININLDGLMLDERGNLFECVVYSDNNNTVFVEDIQDGVFWVEDKNEKNANLSFVKAEKLNFSGQIEFWANIKSIQQSDIFVLYKAIFVNGQLINVFVQNSNVLTPQLKKSKHFIQKKLLLFAASTVHKLSLNVLQIIHNRLLKISS